ncbi:MORN repeat protein, putative [Plasmodium yoelii]|uniref:MORN repeat protein n=2 Tax=Plasmodium yoelii TaxID=5861 RepID=A0AAE9WT86_PLAYO|nr:MORN repeat protein, putative [Plasmodium yoelii]WBY58536.1 MORN repeat protein [Plasmodium yoelii yoelii]VTZ79431.1 MORN repeat protein, putative [Plasmodium yoelii]|eukprot:XP_727890.3 MORN repeat protein, putative [Plasmodium yoelii]
MGNNDLLKIQNSHSYDLMYWKDFFSKNIKENDINSYVKIKDNNIIELKNVKINNKYIFNGLIKLDNYSCPCFYEKFQICNNSEIFIGYFKCRHIKGYGEIISNDYTYKGYISNFNKSQRGSYLFFLLNDNNDKNRKIIKCDGYKNMSLIYSGMWKNDKRYGRGTLKLSFTKKNNIDYALKEDGNKIIYTGWWKNDKRYFYGIQNYINNNCIYLGFWKKNKKWKYGKIIWYYNRKKNITCENQKKKKKKIQNVYIGEWKNDSLNGLGTYFWFKKKHNNNKKKNNNDKKKNNNDKKNNIITHKNANYDKYIGYWKKGKKNGYGIFYYNCGNKYIGMWKNNKKEGLGYMININGSVYKCNFKNNVIISEVQINPEYQINNVYTNSICKLINFFFFETYFNISNKQIQLLYKIIYTNFDFLVDIYERHKKIQINKISKISKINENKITKAQTNANITLGQDKNNFTLINLWEIFYKCNIFNSNFNLSALNKLVIDHTTICEENELFNILKENRPKNDIELFPLDEKKIIKYFFYKSFDILNILHFFPKKSKNKYISLLREHKTYEKETNNLKNKKQTHTIQSCHDPTNDHFNTDASTSTKDLYIDGKKDENCQHNYNSLNGVSDLLISYSTNCKISKKFCGLLKYAIFNKDLYILKGCKELYKIIKFNKKKIKFKQVLKKIYFFLINNKKQYNNNYLYYVLYSLFEASTPLICSFLSMISNKNRKKKIRLLETHNSSMTSIHCDNKSNNKEIKSIRTQKYINNIKFNQINREISEIFQNEDSTEYLKNIIEFTNVHKYNIHDETREISFNCFLSTLVHVSIRLNKFRNITDQFTDIIEILKKNYIKKQNHNYYFGSRKFIKKRKGHSRNDNNNNNNNNNKNNETTEKLLKNNNYIFDLTNKKKATILSLENISSELINILKIYVYYFIFYFLIFESKDSFFSIFNIKLDLSIKLRDVLLFLIQLKLVKKSKKKNTSTGYINLDSYSKISKNNNNKKINIKNKISKILTCSGKNYKNIQKKTLTVQNNDRKNNKELFRHEQKKKKKINLESTRKKDKSNIKKERKKKRTNCKNKSEQNIEIEIKDYPEIGYNQKKNNTLANNKDNKKNLFHKCDNKNGMNVRAKNKNLSNEIFLKKKLNIFSLSYFEILSIFSKILNIKNLHLISESNCDLYFKKIKHAGKRKLHKINKTNMLKMCATRYMRIIQRKRKHIILSLSNSIKKQNNNKICRDKIISVNAEKNEKYSTPIYTKKYGMKIVTLLDKKLSELDKHMDSDFLIIQSEEFKKGKRIKDKDKKKKKKNEKYEKKNKSIYVNDKEKCELNKPDDGMVQKTLIKIKRRHEIKKKIYLLKNNYTNYCKNYMSVIDYYNICLTPYELVLFFLKFVKKVKKKKKIISSYIEVLSIFIFRVLLYNTFIIAKKNN